VRRFLYAAGPLFMACVCAALLQSCVSTGSSSLPHENALTEDTAAQDPAKSASATRAELRFVIPGYNQLQCAYNGFVPTSTTAISIRVNHRPPQTVSTVGKSYVAYRFAAPAGEDTFEVALRNGKIVLSEATFSQTMTAGQTTRLRPEFLGKVASGTLSADDLYPKAGTPSTIHLTFSAKDGTGESIPCGTYAAPVKIAVDDSDGAVSPPFVFFQKHGQTVELAYNGALLEHPFIAAMAGSASPRQDGLSFLVDPYQIIGPARYQISAATAGENGEVWFAQCSGADAGTHCSISYFSAAGKRTDFSQIVPSIKTMTLGSDGNIWFGEDIFGSRSGGPSTIGKIDRNGKVKLFQIGTTDSSANDVSSIISGSDGLIWYDNGGQIGSITTNGTNVKQYPTEAIGFYAWITQGPGNRIYYNGYERTGGSLLCAITQVGAVSCLPNPNGASEDASLTPLVSTGSRLFVYGYAAKIFTVNAKNVFQKITNNGLVPLAYTVDGTLWGCNEDAGSSSPASIVRLTLLNAKLRAATYAENPQESQVVGGCSAPRSNMIAASDGHLWVAGERNFLRFLPSLHANGATP
jgi:hypothetical protein